MPVGHRLLTSGVGSATGSRYTTASIAPAANRLILVTVATAEIAGAPPQPVVTGNSIVYSLITAITSSLGAPTLRYDVFRGMSITPTASEITIDYGGNDQGTCAWIVSEFSSVITTGTNGADAIIQSSRSFPGTSASAITGLLSSFASTNNATFGAVHIANSNVTALPGSGFTEISETTVATRTIMTQWRDSNDTFVDFFWTGNLERGAIAIEIGFAAAALGGGSSSTNTCDNFVHPLCIEPYSSFVYAG